MKAGAKFTVKLTAQIQEGWHLYSLKPLAEGPIPTRIWIAEGQPFSLAGATAAAEPRTLHDASFGMEVELYEGQAVFHAPGPCGRQRAGRSAQTHAARVLSNLRQPDLPARQKR